MLFGRRRFTQLVLHVVEGPDGKPASEYRARFVSLDLADIAEQVDEATLRREIDDNARSVRPVPDAEEQLALAAFKAQARNKKASRSAVAAQVERAASRQTSIIDPLDPPERALVERWRKLVAKRGLQRVSRTQADNDTTLADQHDLLDTSEEVVKLLDLYLPRGTTPPPAP